MKKAINKKRNGFIFYQLQQSCNTTVARNGNRRSAMQCFFIVLYMDAVMARVNATPTTCRGKRPPKGGAMYLVVREGKMFFGFSPLNAFYSNPIGCLTPCVITLIGLRCLFWRQRHDVVILQGKQKFPTTTIVYLTYAYLPGGKKPNPYNQCDMVATIIYTYPGNT